VITKSTIEAELIALDTICSEVERLKDLISEFSIMSRHVPPISIYIYSRYTIELLKQVNVNKKLNMHIQIRLKSIKCLIGKTVILKSEKNNADLLIKDLSTSVVLNTSREMGLNP